MEGFNPRPREEGDFNQVNSIRLLISVSIHALVKRATVSVVPNTLYKLVSIHALVKRATVVGAYITARLGVSIHALVKRATLTNDKRKYW